VGRVRSGFGLRRETLGCQRFGALRALPHGRSRVDDVGLGFRECPSIPSKIPSWNRGLSAGVPRQANACCSFEAPRPRVAATLAKASALDCRAGPHPVSRRMTPRPGASLLIRARSVVQVHPGPPFKSPINTRRFSLSPSWGLDIKKPFCQKFAKSSSRP